MSTQYTTAIQQLYVAYFGRPADTGGLAFWENTLANNGGNLNAISQNFSAAPEYTTTFANMNSYQIVAQIYQNLFGRAPDPEGLKYWGNYLGAGALTIASIVESIAAGAVGSDLVAYNNKGAAAVAFTDALDTTPELLAYNAASLSTAKAYIASVTDDASLAAATDPAALDATTAAVVAVGTPPAPTNTFTLTSGVDAPSAGTGIDNFYATLGTTGATLNGFDTINGLAGTNTLFITDATTAGTMLLPSGVKISNIQAMSVSTSNNVGGAANFDVSGITGLTDLTVTSGAGDDKIKAATTTNVTDSSTGASTISGGKDVTVTAAGNVAVSGAAGAITVTESSNTNVSVTVDGGTNVSVTSAGKAGVAVGSTTAATGTVSVTETATGTVTVKGGTQVAVAANGGNVTVGGSTATNPSGTVSVTQGVSSGTTTVYGGNGVTVTTKGGAVVVGDAIAGVSAGAISITNTSGGFNSDAVTVVGGAAVTVNTTNTTGTINVGVAGTTTVAGTALSNSTSSPTGNVTIVNKGTVNGATVYGTSTTNVNTNGSTNVSVTGAGTTTIADVQATAQTAGANVGTAVGTSKLSSVTLNNVGTTGVTSDALTAVSMTGMSSVVTVTATPAHAMAMTLSAVTTGAGIADATASSMTFSTTAGYAANTSTNTIAVTAAKANVLTFNNAQNITLGTTTLGSASTVTSTSIVANGAGNLSLGTTSGWTGASKLALINAAGATGNVSATINGNVTAFTGGAGNDTVTINTGINQAINGGAGSNTLVLDGAASTFNPPLTPSAAIRSNSLLSNFQTLGLSSNGTGTYNVTGFTGLTHGAIAAAVVYTNVDAATTLALTASAGNSAYTTTYTLADATGTADALSIAIGGSAAVVADGVGAGGGVVANGVETINIASNTTSSSSVTNLLAITDTPTSGKVVYNVSGSSAITLTAGGNEVKTINVTNTAAVNTTGVGLSTTGTVTINGGAGTLTASGSTGTGAVDVITTGTGGGVITLGAGGKVYGTGTGSETVNLAASVAKTDIIKTVDNNVSTINGFTVTNAGSTSDVLNFGAAKTVLADVTSATTSGVANLKYTTINGVLTFSAASGHSMTEFSALVQLAEAAALIGTGNDQVGIVQISGDTYVLASSSAAAGTLATTNVVRLAGVTGITGFATTAATGTSGSVRSAATATTILTADGTLTTQSHATDSVVGTTSTVDADGAGYALLQTNAAADKSANIYTVNDLAQSATIDITANTGAATDVNKLGQIVVTQAGAAGSNNLLVNFNTGAANNQYINSLTTTGDFALNLNAVGSANLVTVAGLIDGGTTNTLQTITITGNKALTLAGIVDTALTTIDASASTAAVNITAPNQAGITVKAVTSTGSTTIVADGAHNSIVQATSTANVTVTSANGAADTITLSNGTNVITAANGAGDTITLGTGANTITAANGAGTTITVGRSTVASGGLLITSASGTGDRITASSASTTNTLSITASGAGDTIDLSGWTTAATTANSTVTALGLGNTIKLGAGTDATHMLNAVVGGNATVTMYGAYDQVDVSNSAAAAGTTSSGAYKMTTINSMIATDAIKFDGSAVTGSLVDVSSATTLGAALDLATAANASGAVNWFQFGGNTYLVEDVNASSTLASNDIIVKLTGTIDLSHATVVGSVITM
jgi:hypothetical protein